MVVAASCHEDAFRLGHRRLVKVERKMKGNPGPEPDAVSERTATWEEISFPARQ